MSGGISVRNGPRVIIQVPAEVIIDHTNDSIRLGDGTAFLGSTTIPEDNRVTLDTYSNSATLEPSAAQRDSIASPGDLLGIGATFTGPWINTKGYVTAGIMVRSDVSSDSGEFLIEFSLDGITVDSEDRYTYEGSSIGALYSVGLNTRFFRVVYKNGLVAQTVFRLQVRCFASSPKPSSHRVRDPLDKESDVEVVKSVVAGEDPFGVFRNVKTTSFDSLTTSLVDSNSRLWVAEVVSMIRLERTRAPD